MSNELKKYVTPPHEAAEYETRPEHRDSHLYMMMRRIINEVYAVEHVDFNIKGLQAGEQLLDRPLTPEDVVVDVGSSNGKIIADAAISIQSKATIICVEPDVDAASSYSILPPKKKDRISFVRATGEDLPLKADSAIGLTMHNVIFRAKDSRAMLEQAKRVVVPGGFIAISSNAREHAKYRHLFEKQVALTVAERSGFDITPPPAPAEGNYLEDLPALIRSVGQLVIRDDLYASQDTHAVITRGRRLNNYLDSIKYSAVNTNVPPELRSEWRAVVNTDIMHFIEDEMKSAAFDLRAPRLHGLPYFADPIKRGMIVMRNDKEIS